MAPWSCIICSAAIDSVRWRMRRARSSDCPHLALFLVGQRQDAQRQDLVDLGAVEQVARTLGRDLRVVVQDDGRRQHGVAGAVLAREHRPHAHVLAAGRQLRVGLGRIEQGHELARLSR